MIIWISFIIIIFILSQNVGNTLELHAVAFYFDTNSEYFTKIVDEFNENYGKSNNITVILELLTPESGSTLDNFRSTVEIFLKKKKYDIYIYENVYISMYSPYLLDLNEYLSKDIIDMYDPKIISDLCYYNNKLLGLPIFLIYTAFYVNRTFLEKYNKPIPKTWDEMVDIGKFILNEERKENNTDLSGYNGLFCDSTQGTQSIYEFIYSFRDSIDAKFPEIGSQSFIDALEMMKKIKNELSSNEEFRSDEAYTYNKILNGQSIFLKFWILGEPLVNYIVYNITNLPGSKNGISTSIPSGFNIGISKDIDEERIDETIIAFKYFSSKDIQKRFLKNRQLITAIKSLYKDEEICKDADCELFLNMQPLSDPFFTLKDKGNYPIKFRNYIYEYLYGDMTPQEVSKKILDIERIYNIN